MEKQNDQDVFYNRVSLLLFTSTMKNIPDKSEMKQYKTGIGHNNIHSNPTFIAIVEKYPEVKKG
jgi:hypothetical protein